MVRKECRNSRKMILRKNLLASRGSYDALERERFKIRLCFRGHHFVAQAAYPISKKMLRNSSRTFMSGCSAPDGGGAPSAAKLYFLKLDFFHAPLPVETWYQSRTLWKASNAGHALTFVIAQRSNPSPASLRSLRIWVLL